MQTDRSGTARDDDREDRNLEPGGRRQEEEVSGRAASEKCRGARGPRVHPPARIWRAHAPIPRLARAHLQPSNNPKRVAAADHRRRGPQHTKVTPTGNCTEKRDPLQRDQPIAADR